MKIIESEFDFIARKGAISRARKQAFKNLLTKGMRNYVQVVVWAKSGFEYYAVMVYVDKETSVMKMQEFKHNGPKRLAYTEETQIIITGSNRQTSSIIRDLKVEFFDTSRKLIVGGMNSNSCEPVVTIKSEF